MPIRIAPRRTRARKWFGAGAALAAVAVAVWWWNSRFLTVTVLVQAPSGTDAQWKPQTEASAAVAFENLRREAGVRARVVRIERWQPTPAETWATDAEELRSAFSRAVRGNGSDFVVLFAQPGLYQGVTAHEFCRAFIVRQDSSRKPDVEGVRMLNAMAIAMGLPRNQEGARRFSPAEQSLLARTSRLAYRKGLAEFGKAQLQLVRSALALRFAGPPGRVSAVVESYLGGLLSLEGEYGAASAAYQRALAIDPNSPAALFGLGVEASREGSADKAAKYFYRVQQLDPDYRDVYSWLAEAVAITGDFAGAEVSARQAIARQPASARAHLIRGVALSRLPGRLSEARQEFAEALTLAPDYRQAYRNLRAAAMLEVQLDRDRAHQESVLGSNPNSATAYYNLAIAQFRAGDMRAAETSLRSALRLKKDFPEAEHNLAVVLYALGRDAEAWEAVERARHLGLSPKEPLAEALRSAPAGHR